MRVTAVTVQSGTPRHLPRAAVRLACVVFALALLPACSWMPFRHGSKEGKVNDCNKPQLYEQAASTPPLRIPDGLDALNTRGALRIPELREPEAPRKLTDACLEEPPKFSNAKLLPPPRDKKAEKGRAKAEAAILKYQREQEKAAKKAAKTAPPAPATAPAPSPAPAPEPAPAPVTP